MKGLEHRDLSEFNLSKRKQLALASASDSTCFHLAERISRNAKIGIPTHHLERKLEVEISKMMFYTRVLNGYVPEAHEVKRYKYNK